MLFPQMLQDVFAYIKDMDTHTHSLTTSSGRCRFPEMFLSPPLALTLEKGAGVWEPGDTRRGNVCLLLVPFPEPAPKGIGTWSVRKSLSFSRRLPPLVAMGTVIFIITPWMGNKPKFWICGQRRWGVSVQSVQGAGKQGPQGPTSPWG